jgi:hypothetical protein
MSFVTVNQRRIELISPASNARVINAQPTLVWSARNVPRYTVELASDSNFSQIILRKEVSESSYTISNTDLMGISALITQSYFWRVRATKLLPDLLSTSGSFFVIAIPSSGSGYAGSLHVNSASFNQEQVGSKEAPFKTIQYALIGADILRNTNAAVSFDILVAAGTYNEEVDLLAGMALRGGYEATNWTRNISGNITTITAKNSTGVICQNIGSGYQTTTILEGFTVNGGTISGNTNPALSLSQCSVQVLSNTLKGGSGGATTYGVYVNAAAAGASPILSDNTITGCTSGTSCHGVFHTGASATVIKNNMIQGCITATANCYGINAHSTAKVSVLNNVIIAGSGAADTYGMNPNGNFDGDIINNTINGGNGTSSSTGIRFNTTSTSVKVINNIIFTQGGAQSRCFSEVNSGQDPDQFSNNNLFGCPTALYRDENLSDLDAMCAGGKPGAVCPGTDVALSNTANNAAAGSLGTLFVNAGGGDYHLLGTAASAVRTGGASQTTIFTTDKDGLTRTVGWSMGAYEKD